MIADHRTGVAAGVEVEPILHPLLLNELELAKQTGTDRHEDDAVLTGFTRRGAIELTVGEHPAQDTAAIDDRRTGHRTTGGGERWPQRVPRNGPTHVRGQRTGRARWRGRRREVGGTVGGLSTH